ncbi:MAG: outer membrane protein assembly factor [Paludibacteraceae bacterium]|nr:outer membrane protein assembly factor [Paludibacteraceae bacterium]
MKSYLLVCLLVLISTGSWAVTMPQKNDSLPLSAGADTCRSVPTPATKGATFLDKLQNLPAIAVPTVSFANETSWAFGAAGVGYFRLPSDSLLGRLSEATLAGSYTLRHQWNINASLTLYIDPKWQVAVKLRFRHYPYFFFGKGNEPANLLSSDDKVLINSNLYEVFVQPLYAILPNLHVGPTVDWQYETAGLYNTRYCQLGVGGVLQYDSRDNLYYPHRGLFIKAQAYYLPDLIDHDHMGRVQLDIRHFVPLYQDLILAYQLYAESLLGQTSEYKALQLMPQLGGDELLRGFYKGKFRDNTMLALQAELRIPIWKLFKAAVFAGMGDVYDMHNWHWATPKIGYGAGLRLQFNKSGINLRFDVARNNIDKSWTNFDSYSFYVQVKEAF